MAITTDSVMADTVPTVLENARFTEQFSAIMSGLVWKIRKKLHDGKNVNVPIFGTITARALTEALTTLCRKPCLTVSLPSPLLRSERN